MTLTMSIGEKIREFRKKRGWTQEKLAELIGVDQTTISAYEHNRRSIDIDTLMKIAEALNIPISVFFDDQEVIPIEFPKAVKTVPLFDTEVSAGNGAFPEAFQPIELIPVDRRDVDYAFTVHGRSMEPILLDGDIVFVKALPVTEVRTGDMVVAIYDNRFFVKWIKFDGDRIMLLSENPEYEVIVVDPYDRFEVIGKVVEIKREITRKRFKKG